MTAAFKEWAIIVDALGRGEQIFILRKGGIHEGRGGFQPEYREFFLFPTLFHQQRESVLPPAQARFDQIAPDFPPSTILRFQYWTELTEWQRVEDFDAIVRLEGLHIWREEVLREKFEWGRERSVFALVLRVYQLPVAIELPMLPEYGGCKSWVQVANHLKAEGSVPVLSDLEFERERSDLLKALTG